MGNGAVTPKKILIMTFDDSYIQSKIYFYNFLELSSFIINKKISIPKNKGYLNQIKEENNIMYTFLSSEMRKIWLHHFMGTSGIILLYEGENINKTVNELFTHLSNKYLRHIPILILFDKNKIKKNFSFFEEFRENLSKLKKKYCILYVNFEYTDRQSEIYFGLDWIEKQVNK